MIINNLPKTPEAHENERVKNLAESGRKTIDICISIDPGVKTGFAVWSVSDREFYLVETLQLHQAMSRILNLSDSFKLHVRVEDARKRKYFGNSGREVLQGAGSVKRDCSAWQEFLEYHKIPFDMPSPKQKGAKVTAEYFKKLTGWKNKCSQHARDAALLVFGL